MRVCKSNIRMRVNLNDDRLRFGLIIVGLICIFLVSSCAGGHVTRNGIFQDHHQSTKEELVGEWRMSNEESIIPGQVVYKFFKDGKGKVALNVNGEDVEMRYFDAYDQLSISFHYMDKDKNDVYVFAQFKNYLKNELMIHSENATGGVNEQTSLAKDESRFLLKKVVAANKQ